MPQFNNRKMCSQCPFRVGAAKGWLGPWDPIEVDIMARRDLDFYCHMDLDVKQEADLTAAERNAQVEHCVGILRYMNAECKLSRDKQKADVQRELKGIEDDDVIPARQFVVYHTLPDITARST